MVFYGCHQVTHALSIWFFSSHNVAAKLCGLRNRGKVSELPNVKVQVIWMLFTQFVKRSSNYDKVEGKSIVKDVDKSSLH